MFIFNTVEMLLSFFFFFFIEMSTRTISGICESTQDVSKVKVKLATVVEGDPKVPFSIATIARCRGGRYSFPMDCFTLTLIVPYIVGC